MRPLLAFGVDGQEKNISAAIDALADQLHLSPEDRQLLVPSGKQTLLANRVHWARTYLDKAGALRRTRRSHFVVTDRGKELLKKYPDRIETRTLRQFPEFVVFQTPRVDRAETGETGTSAQSSDQQTAIELPSATPEETLQSAADTISEALRTQLLDRMR